MKLSTMGGRTTSALRALNGGELSPRVAGRSDLPNYASSAERCENLFPLVTGPILRRSGTRFVKEVKDSTKPVALLPFVVSTSASYVIEAGNLYFRFYTSEGRLESPIGSAVEVVTPYTSSEVFDLQYAQSADTLYLVHPLHAPRKLVRTSATTFSLSVIDFQDGPYLDENTDPAKTLAFGAATGATTCTAVGHAPFLAGRDEGRLIRSRPGSTGGAVFWAKITAVTTTALVNCTIMSDQPALMSSEHRWMLGVWYVNNYPRAITFNEQRLCFGGAPDSIQRVDLSEVDDYERFSPTGSRDDKDHVYSAPDIFADNAFGYTIGSSELNAVLWTRIHQRLTIGTSRSIYEMAASSQGEALTPDNANVYEVDMTGSSEVFALRMANTILFAGRDHRSLHALGFSVDADTNVASDLTQLADHIPSDGIVQIASTPQPIPLVWICTEDGQLASLTLEPRQKVFGWARHPLGGRNPGFERAHVRSITGIPVSDHDQLWLVVERWIEGVLVQYVEFMEQPFRLVTTEAQEEAFFVDGAISYDTPIAMTNATQTSPVVVTAPSHGLLDGTRIRIRGVIGMTELNGKSYTVSAAGLHTFELLHGPGNPVNGLGFTAYGTGGQVRVHATTFTGLDHLEGETVSVLADGAVRPGEIVSGGSVTLASSASEVQIGLPYPSLWVSERLDQDEREGPSGGKSRTFDAVTLRLVDSLGGEVGAGEDGPFVRIPSRKGDDPMDAAPPIQNGEVRVTFPGGWSREPRIAFRQTDPLPLTVLSAVLFGEVGGR